MKEEEDGLMNFGWINWINIAAVGFLITVNIIAAKKRASENFRSQYLMINILEQIGRYGSIVFMIFPIFTKRWEFGFMSVGEMLVWICGTVLLLTVYGFLWMKKSAGGASVLYGLALTPVILFLMNGILLRHPALILSSFLFGVSHLIIVKENRG